MREQVREKFTPVEPRTRVFAAEPPAVYEAARTALDRMEFRVLRGGAAQGRIEAVSGVTTGNSLREARQIAMTVRLRADGEGGTEVAVNLTEILENDSSNAAGTGTETPLRDTPLYEVFFRYTEQALGAAKG